LDKIKESKIMQKYNTDLLDVVNNPYPKGIEVSCSVFMKNKQININGGQ